MTAATKTNRETWRDWMPPGAPEPELITRDELIEALAGDGVAITTRSLENWQLQEIIPYPTRQRHEGATRGMYPVWMIAALKHLRDAQDRGLSLEKIRPLMRTHALSGIRWDDPLAKSLAEVRAAITAYVHAWQQLNSVDREVNGVVVSLTDGSGNEDSEIAYFDFPIVPVTTDQHGPR